MVSEHRHDWKGSSLDDRRCPNEVDTLRKPRSTEPLSEFPSAIFSAASYLLVIPGNGTQTPVSARNDPGHLRWEGEAYPETRMDLRAGRR